MVRDAEGFLAVASARMLQSNIKQVDDCVVDVRLRNEFISRGVWPVVGH